MVKDDFKFPYSSCNSSLGHDLSKFDILSAYENKY